MVTWQDFNTKVSSGKNTTISPAWNKFNSSMRDKAFAQEANSQSSIDKSLFTTLKKKGLSTNTINQNLAPKPVSATDVAGDMFNTAKSAVSKVSEIVKKATNNPIGKTFGSFFRLTHPNLALQSDTLEGTSPAKKVLQDIAQAGEGLFRGARASSQALASFPAAMFAGATPDVSPTDAAKESLRMARDILTNSQTSPEQGVETAAQMWLKNRGVGKYGGKEPDIFDVAALSTLGVFNLFGDPVFEVGLVKRGAAALKEATIFQKIAETSVPLEPGATFIKGTTRKMEIPIADGFKVKVIPKNNEIVLAGYKNRFMRDIPVGGEVSPEANQLIKAIEENTGTKLTTELRGNDLVLRPTLLTTPDRALLPEAATKSTTVQGAGFTMAEKADKAKIAEMKARDTYSTELKKYNAKPTPTQLQKVLNAKQAVESFAKPQEKQPASSGGVFASLARETKLQPQEAPIMQKSATVEQIKQTQPNEVVASKPVEIAPLIPKSATQKSKLGVDIEAKAIEEGLTKELGDLPEYKTMNMAEQAQKAKELLDTNPELAKQIALGQGTPPEGLRVGSVYVAMKKQAFANKDLNLIRELAQSPVGSQASELGQQIKAFDSADPNDPVAAIQQVSRARETTVTRQAKVRDIKAARAKVVKEIKQKIKTPKLDEWETFIQSIKC